MMRSPEMLDRCTEYVLQTARHIVHACGPRAPGSDGERQAQQFIGRELEPATDGPVTIEAFAVAPRAFMSTPRISGLLLLGAILLWWVSLTLALVLSAAALLTLVFEVGLYWQLIDSWFPKQTSHNVLGVQRPSGQVSRRVVLNAHTDAAYEWRWLYLWPTAAPFLVYYSLASVAIVFCIDAAMVIREYCGVNTSGHHIAAGLALLAFIPGAVLGIAFTSFRHVSPGANDDLSGALIVTGIAKHLRASGMRLENTELVYLITGSEEAGLRGAKAFTECHKDAWNDVPTVVVTLDTIRDLEHLHVYNRDRNGTVRHDALVCQLLHDAGRRCGVELGYASVYLGATDATAFTLAGHRAAALSAMDPRPAHYYHNRRDCPDNMSGPCIRKTIEIVLDAIAEYDRHGLPLLAEYCLVESKHRVHPVHPVYPGAVEDGINGIDRMNRIGVSSRGEALYSLG
jgi:hypothetical protein